VLGLLAVKLGAASVTCLDNSAPAVLCAHKNFSEKIPPVSRPWKVLYGSLFSHLTETYDVVMCNPPFHTEKITNYRLGEQTILQSSKVLKKDGCLYLVGNAFINYKKAGREHFSSIEVLSRNRKYIVYRMKI